MSRNGIRSRRRSAPGDSISRARRAEINAAYHVRREIRRLTERLRRIADTRAVESRALVERLLRIIVEGGLARKAQLEIKKIEQETACHCKTGHFHNISNQLINITFEKIHRKTDKKGA